MTIPARNSAPAAGAAGTMNAGPPALQWANGITKAKRNGDKRATGIVGWYSEAGKDNDFDAVCHAAGVERITVVHQDQSSGNNKETTDWYFGNTIVFYPLTTGPLAATVGGCLSRYAVQTADAALAMRWPEGAKSQLSVQGYVTIGDALVLVRVTASSTMTDKVLAAILDHVRVAEYADKIVDRTKHPDPIGLYELALTLTDGEEYAAGAKKRTSAAPVLTTAVVPVVSGHPAELTPGYIKNIYNRDIAAYATEDWDAAVAWAHEYQQFNPAKQAGN